MDASREFKDYMASLQKRLVLLHSFWGLEKPQALPPNLVMLGPISKPPTDLLVKLKEKDAVLSDWLDKAHENKEDVIYVSIGSEATWQQWSIDTIYQGLKQMGIKVVWSLRLKEKQTDVKLPEENPNFYIKPW